jgi:hypothetical protein
MAFARVWGKPTDEGGKRTFSAATEYAAGDLLPGGLWDQWAAITERIHSFTQSHSVDSISHSRHSVSPRTPPAGADPPAEAKKRLEKLLTKLAKVPDTYTTATHYSRYHLMILEAAILGMTDDF